MGEVIVSNDTRELVRRWQEKPVPFVRRLGLTKSAYSKIEGSESVASPKILESLRALGFRFLGLYGVMGLVPFTRKARERWVDPTGLVVISARRGTPRGPIEATLSQYLLITHFEDGTVMSTWSKTPAPVSPIDRVVDRGGTGSLDFDYRSHMDAVKQYAEKKNTKPLVVDSLDLSLELGDYYDTYLRPQSLWTIQMTRLMLLVMVGTIAWSFFRHHG